MKKLFGVLFAALVIYIIYFDLTVGTLPAAITAQKVDSHAVVVEKTKPVLPSFDAKVKPGDTLVSIVEHKLGKSLPVSINDLIEDFQQLNPGKSAEKIKIGATYHFPDYSK
ncbi:LysM peptidoglycan-binding domain-containing protein [Bacillus sp. BRMEA1]|uniref:LysM peptidoglycan-binding domain-containing protein n=1 Tax=Neobacillus endophyticus TaxID=2738405 RepID=UPI001564DFDE|nr:LysM domain-containing protein [Neobacillus endophyticus]NRD80772.1 LysM peptidoglycan-binding domain-containing protein [Neobacillus endophyticus]